MRMKLASTRLLISALLAVALGGCGSRPEAPSESGKFRPTASIQDIMQHIVDPAADGLWESVEVTITSKGEETKQPRNAEEWKTVRSYAIQLAEAANLLAIDKRPVAHGGKALEDSHIKEILPAEQIQAKIDANRPAFNAYARTLQDSADLAIAAVDAKDVAKLVNIGAKIDHACEQCHLAYWYPNDKRPTEFVVKKNNPGQ